MESVVKPLPWGFAPQPHLGSPYLTSPCRRTLASHPACSFDLIKTRLKASRHLSTGHEQRHTAVFVFRFFFQTVGRLSNDATYSSGRNNGGTLFCCRDERCFFHCKKGGYKQRDVNASRFFSLLPHVEPIMVLPHERDMNRSSVAARIERRVTCVDTSEHFYYKFAQTYNCDSINTHANQLAAAFLGLLATLLRGIIECHLDITNGPNEEETERCVGKDGEHDGFSLHCRKLALWHYRRMGQISEQLCHAPPLLLALRAKGWILHYPLKQTPDGFSRLA
ncbi:hypothetical protein EAG_10921 [Camponotus floridanus]|uniref:Uncharacterized protein n=1 Tax=Camponotus floridanus TaxID=104421 RepID=E2ALQ5_CAMFO|nr:hypothetical protein EAG_10921 [Camponotus floridanus]